MDKKEMESVKKIDSEIVSCISQIVELNKKITDLQKQKSDLFDKDHARESRRFSETNK